MLSAVRTTNDLVGVEVNMFWDGLFHAVTWTLTVSGLALLWRAVRRRDVPKSTPVLVGSMVAGWGWFNLVEGVIDHELLRIHHVVERLGASAWDWVFLASGVMLIAAGLAVVRTALPRARGLDAPTTAH
jgi:uncharacterized membrane protein